LWHGPLSGQYFQLDGTTSAFIGTVYVTFFTSARQMMETVAVISATTSAIGISGAVGNKTNNNAAPGATNLGALIGLANAAQPTWTEGNTVLASVNLKGAQRGVIQDAALNDRGANVNANNELTIIDQGRRPAGTALNTYSVRIASSTTTTPTSSTAYVSSIAICVETAGTTSTLDIRDKSGTPIYLVRSLGTTSILSNGNDVYNFQAPIKMTSGIDIITGGAAAATVGVFIDYYQ
jgi:hypothetical protein